MTMQEHEGALGVPIAAVVEEVTDVKRLSKRVRQELQVSPPAGPPFGPKRSSWQTRPVI
jgi:hypothetical protein